MKGGGEQIIGDQACLEQAAELGVCAGELLQRRSEDGIGFVAAKEEELTAAAERSRLSGSDRVSPCASRRCSTAASPSTMRLRDAELEQELAAPAAGGGSASARRR